MNQDEEENMRRLIFGLVILCWSMAKANLLQNPGFENGIANWQMVYGSAQLTDYSRSGAYAMKLVDGDSACIQQINIPVSQNTNYRLWIWAAMRSGGTSYPSNVRFRIWVNNTLVLEENNSGLGMKWVGRNASFNSGSASAISVSFSCFW